MNREVPWDQRLIFHANVPDEPADWLMHLPDFRTKGYIGTDVVRTPYGVRMSTRAFNILCDRGDGTITSNQGDKHPMRMSYQLWIEGVPYTAFAEAVGEPPTFAPLWNEDETSLLVWAAQARCHDPLTVFASDADAAEARRGADGNELPYQGAAVIIDYLNSLDATRATTAQAVGIDPDTPDDLLAAAAWAARADHAKRRRDDAIRRCVRYDLTSQRDIAARVGLSGHAAIDRILKRESPTDEI